MKNESQIAVAEPSALQRLPEPTPMMLIQSAMDSGCDPDRLGKLMVLQERWERTQAEKAFAESMHAAQSSMPNIAKTGQNTHTKIKYALLEEVQRQAKPVYEQHGFSMSFGEDDCPLEKHKRTVCDVTHIAGHSRRYHLDLPVDSSGSMNAVQGCISTTSYAQRRLTCLVWNITIGGEDDDGASATVAITPDQVAVLNGLLDLIHPDDDVLSGMLNWAGVESLNQLPVSKYAKAKDTLEKKAAKYTEQ